MSLPKLPYEYPAVRRRDWQECFGDLSPLDQLKIADILDKMEELLKRK